MLPATERQIIDDPEDVGSSLDYRENFYIDLYRRVPYKIRVNDGYVEVTGASNIGRLEKIIVIITDVYSPPAQVNVKFVIVDGVNPEYNIILPVIKKLTWAVPETFAGYIESIWISTSELTYVNVDTRLISTVDPPAVE